MEKQVALCVDEHGKVLNVYSTMEKAKAAWELSYGKLFTPCFKDVQGKKGSEVEVLSPKGSELGRIVLLPVYNYPEHL